MLLRGFPTYYKENLVVFGTIVTIYIHYFTQTFLEIVFWSGSGGTLSSVASFLPSDSLFWTVAGRVTTLWYSATNVQYVEETTQ